MKKSLSLIFLLAVAISATAQQKVLVAYFSFTNNTKAYAEKIATMTGGDLYEIVPQVAYGDENNKYYDESTRAYQEQRNTGGEQRPEIFATLTNAEQYNIIFLGSPIWYGKSPRVILTFLDTYGFAGKTVVPFVTSASTGISQVNEELPSAYPCIHWIEGKRLNGMSDSDLQTWVQGIMQTTTALQDVSAETPTAKGVYTLSGLPLSSADNLPAGVYLINGQKQIIK
ncbi:MAG: hypothetical protein IJU35_01150 [Paludibacteraceae bacterium]|nr:hypothetical protein [Paludibacteraceae bacterium]